MKKRYLYFAYGSNLNLEQMKARCPDSRIYGPGILYEFKLMFRTHLDIEKDHRSKVEGTLFEVSERDLENLDRYEGVPRYYTREPVEVTCYNKELLSFVYIMRNQTNTNLPSIQYWNVVSQGYKDCHMSRRSLYRALKRSGGYLNLNLYK